MNYLKNLIYQNNLLPADVIVLRKKLFGMVDHFAVFLGYDYKQQPVIVANYTAGTKRISQNELNLFMESLNPERVERFTGNNLQRQKAVQRGLSKIGENNYNYFDNNCEHYASFVQKGVAMSKQADAFKDNMGTIGTIAVGSLLLAAVLSILDSE
jgi:hypothetical protein